MLNNIHHNIKNQDNLIEQSKISCNFLAESASELQKQIDKISERQKEYCIKLKEKEIELLVEESKYNDKKDVFSPIQNSKNEISKLSQEIDHFHNKINDLTEEQKILQAKKLSFTEAYQSMNQMADKIIMMSAKEEPVKRREFDFKLNILQALESERHRISRDLHDSTVQNLAGLVHKIELCTKLLDMDLIRARLELSNVGSTIKSVINDIRSTIYNLKPMSLDDLGLVVTLERYVKLMMDPYEIQVRIHSNEENLKVLPVINLTLFRVIQEACNNIVKHAKASLIDITISYNTNNITVTIQDNGVGFQVEEKLYEEDDDQLYGLGLSIMKERVFLLSGTIDIQSKEGQGTNIIVTVPLITSEGKYDEKSY
ncbi:MAG: hypothetical protein K0S47_3746 [Herbinix sp.]|jgi:two-component system sensor histidine kinase DegS|nr:hypothetical protein [Herbinix sp.]MDF2801798.1 hypothetical protein [Anaerocolumna sp.]